MIKRLTKVGNSHALVIDKPLLDAMGIDAGTPLQLTVTGSSLIVTPVDADVGREGVAKSVGKLRRRYGGMLKRLAE